MIKGVTSDSREVKPGFVFVAIKGLTHDGHDYIDEAIKKGAVKIYEGKEKLGELAAEFYGDPSKKLKVIGVTGTKGKTTTCHIIHHILTKLGQKTGLISSITTPGFHVTTPDVLELNKMLKKMVDDGCKYAVVEVSSHGIDQGRVMGINFEVAALTNIAPEHLDYHKSFAEYKKTKLSFLHSAKIPVTAKEKTDLNILPGKFNNLNAQLAIDVVGKLGFDRIKALKALDSFKLPEGRLEEINNDWGIRIFIDFAHTPESLGQVLTYLRSLGKGKVISVFGCAGERDPGKRMKMGKISTEIADISVFTAEDPRTENIFEILRSMKEGAIKGKFTAVPERSEAIAYALSIAKKGDVIGIFGKGHERSMSYKGFEHHWSDRKIVESILKGKKDISVIVLAAGMGTRMKSQTPKVLMEISGRPMLSYTLENLRLAGFREIIVVVGFKKDEVIERFGGAVKFAVQETPKGGTADAARAGFKYISPASKILAVINGDDSAFYKPETITRVVNDHFQKKAVITFVSLIRSDPFGLGRVIRDESGGLTGIIEEKDASDDEKKINEVNDGLYVFDRIWFSENIGKVKKGPQGEYYLVDLVKMAVTSGEKVNVFRLPDDSQWQGVNTPEQLKVAQEKMDRRLRIL